MKKLAIISLIAAILFLLTACTLDAFESYENFVNDMDISARIEDALYSANKGDTSPFFIGSVKAIYNDLMTYNYIDSSSEAPSNAPSTPSQSEKPAKFDYAQNINQDYIGCVQDLLNAINDNKAGKKNEAQLDYASALDKYRNAQTLYDQFIHKSGRANNYGD